MALISKVPCGTLAGKMCEWNGNFGISENESSIKVGKTKERLTIFDLSGFGPILDYLDFVRCHGEAFWRQHISKVFTGSDVKFTFVCMGKKSVSVESVKYPSDMSLMFSNVVRVDE